MKYTGVYTALITPFDRNNEVDFAALDELLIFQLKSSISGIVILGSTGESNSLTREERIAITELTIKMNNLVARGKKRIIVGIGSGNLHNTLNYFNDIPDEGVSTVLLNIPAYINPSQEGIYLYITTVCEYIKKHNKNIDIILYNVPTRTGRNINPETLQKILEKSNNISSIKDAYNIKNSIEYMKVIENRKISLISGNDDLFYETLQIGSSGIISVISNAYPEEMSNIYHNYKSGKIHVSKIEFDNICDLINVLSVETNPIAIKFLLSAMGLIKENYRLPLCSASIKNQMLIKKAFEAFAKS